MLGDSRPGPGWPHRVAFAAGTLKETSHRACRDHGMRPGRVDARRQPRGTRATPSPSSTSTPTRSAGCRPHFRGRKVTRRGPERTVLEESGIRQAERLRRGQSAATTPTSSRRGSPARRSASRTWSPASTTPPRRGLRAARHPDGRHRAVDRRPDAAPACSTRAPQTLWRDPSGTVRLAEVTLDEAWIGRRARPSRSRPPASGWRSSPASARACCRRRTPCSRRATCCNVMRARLEDIRRGAPTRAWPAAPEGAADAGRHRRSRRRRPLDRRASSSRTATRCCSSTRTPDAIDADADSRRRVAARRRLRDRQPRERRARAAATSWSPRPATTRSTWWCRCWPRPSSRVPRVVARVNHPANEWLFTEAWGVDVAVSTPRLLAALVEEAVEVGDLVRLLTLPAGPGQPGRGHPADDAPLRRPARSATCRGRATRAGGHLARRPGHRAEADDPLEGGDELLFVASPEVEDELRGLLLLDATRRRLYEPVGRNSYLGLNITRRPSR